MLRHRVGAVCLAVLGLLAFPREGSAHILDIIWEMSGPQMIGFPGGCEYRPQAAENERKLECRLTDKLIGRTPAPRRDLRSFWVALDSTVYFSTGKDSNDLQSEFLKTWMVAAEPMLMRGSWSDASGVFTLYHGAGVSYDFLFGQDFSAFDKFGFKFQPIGFRYYNLTVAYILRTYHNGFTPDEFGVGDRQDDLNRPFEVVHGITAGFRF